MKEGDIQQVADFMHEAIQVREDEEKLAELRGRVFAFNQSFPLPE